MVGLISHVKTAVKPAAGWMRDNFRIVGGAAAALIMIVILTVVLNLSQLKQVELIVDGHGQTVRTKAVYVQELLAEQGISLAEADEVSVPLTDRVSDHARIEVNFAVPVTITADGRSIERMTTAEIVAELLQEAGYELGEWDEVQPGLTSPIEAGQQIRIARIEKRIETENEIIPYEIVTTQDPAIVKGKEKVLQEGYPGMIEHVYERVYEDGQLREERLISTTQQRAPTNKVVAVGTRSEVAILSASSPNIQTVTKDGVTFGVKKIIEATLTAYDAGPESTGKTEDHPEYGITYTGTKVKEGRTVAVDPKVIPLGWWMYIEGYGFRRAEDKGSGVKGNWVDIYFDSHEEAEKFGKKKGTVYIIGPEHPLEN
ncbi:hypothetical protein PRECH8_16930 [Insulibacter thermoxylanivorax]|uniref:G5 domain-containing protein n=1 Tax=Insulibacter thermoxylanivorax TaxID=2749268 RepID=A0A916QHC4_9BACL|nr:hypothetical protein PRECH8_16930 [Insulibacter thermoxylanivorax]